MRYLHRTRIAAAAAVALAAVIVPGFARADGGMFPTRMPPYYLVEDRQAALLDWRADTGTEALTVQPGISGYRLDFAWVVPTPGLPAVTAADPGLFADLRRATDPVRSSRDRTWHCAREGYITADAGVAPPVDVVFSDLVGDFDVTVIRAADAGALADSLEAWGFLDDTIRADVVTVLDDYVARGWSFVAARLDTNVVQLDPDRMWAYGSGISPLTMTFAADRPVYPMKLSALSAADRTAVDVTVVADHRWTFAGGEAVYANRVSAGELAELGRLAPSFAAQLAPGRFVTRLTRSMTPSQMTVDLVLEQAPNDDEFRIVTYSGVPVTMLLFVIPAVTWFVQRQRRGGRRRTSRPPGRGEARPG